MKATIEKKVTAEDIRKFLNTSPDATNLTHRFVTDREVGLSVRREAEYFARPRLGVYEGLFVKLSGMVNTSSFPMDVIDDTGRNPKINFVAQVEQTIVAKSSIRGAENVKTFHRPIVLTIGVPKDSTFNVQGGEGVIYANPGILEPAFTVEGAWNEKKGQTNVYNHLAPVNGSFWTAAAFQMARFYVEYHLLPLLRGRPVMHNFAAVPGQLYNVSVPSNITVYLPQELANRHTPSALSILYHACEAEDIMIAAGYPVMMRVWNMTGNLAGQMFDIDSFWQAFHILCLTACGTGNTAQFEMDFLLAIVQLFPLHGNCDEGGIYRQYFQNYAVQQNVGVVVSNYSRQTNGFYRINEVQILASALTFQTIISRTLYETQLDVTEFMKAPRCTNDDAKTAILSVMGEIRANMASATGIEVDYFQHYIGNSVLPTNIPDRHISGQHPNFFRQFSGFMPTYSLNCHGNDLGTVSFNSKMNTPLVFDGNYAIESVQIDNQIYFDMPMYHNWRFSDGFYWIHPSYNPEDGIMELQYAGSVISHDNQELDDLNLVDGRVLRLNDQLGTAVWNDNGDILPSAGCLRTPIPGVHLIKGAYIPSYAMRGEYRVSVSKYVPIGKQKGEGKGSEHSRWDTYLNNRRSFVTNEFGVHRPVKLTTREFFRSFMRYSRERTDREVKRIEMSEKLHSDTVGDIMGENCIDPKDYDVKLVARGDYEKLFLLDPADDVLRLEVEKKNKENIVKTCTGAVYDINAMLALKEIIYDAVNEHSIGDKEVILARCGAFIHVKKQIKKKVKYFSYVGRRDINEAMEALEKQKMTGLGTGKKYGDELFIVFGCSNKARPWSSDTYAAELGIQAKELTHDAAQMNEQVLGSLARWLSDVEINAILGKGNNFGSEIMKKVKKDFKVKFISAYDSTEVAIEGLGPVKSKTKFGPGIKGGVLAAAEQKKMKEQREIHERTDRHIGATTTAETEMREDLMDLKLDGGLETIDTINEIAVIREAELEQAGDLAQTPPPPFSTSSVTTPAKSARKAQTGSVGSDMAKVTIKHQIDMAVYNKSKTIYDDIRSEIRAEHDVNPLTGDIRARVEDVLGKVKENFDTIKERGREIGTRIMTDVPEALKYPRAQVADFIVQSLMNNIDTDEREIARDLEQVFGTGEND